MITGKLRLEKWMERILTRGKLAAETGCNIETIRFYEKIGLMPDPKRTVAGYRQYAPADRARLQFILRARELGFSIADLRDLLGLVDGGDYTCAEVKQLTLAHLRSVRARIADLKRLEKTLASVSAQCDGDSVPQCPIIDALFQPVL
jgi:MerR family mercuric resistance operon transcriptional regulator